MHRHRQTEIDRDPQKLPSTTSYHKACTKYFPVQLRTTRNCTKYVPVQLRTTKLAQSTSQYYFVLQSLHKVLPSTTSYYKACTNYSPVLFRTKACTKYFPILLRTTQIAQSTSQQLRTTKLAQSTSQYYFVRQSLRKVFHSTTSCYKVCTKYFPVTTSLITSKSQFYRSFLTIEHHFAQKGCDRHFKIAILLQFLTIEPHFVRKGCAGRFKSKSQFYLRF